MILLILLYLNTFSAIYITSDCLQLAVGQVEQLKEDVAVKEAELVRANKQIDKLEKDKIALKLEIQNTNIILQHTRTELKEKKIENERLYKTLSDDEIKLLKLRKDLDNTTNEKDLIGTQMIRRNDEIGLLNEKINIIQMALDRGIKEILPLVIITNTIR